MLENFDISALYADWALVLFTTFAQFAVGTALFASIVTLVSEGLEAGLQEAIEEREVRKKLWRASFFLLVLSLLLSSFHVQNPLLTLFNIKDLSLASLNSASIVVGLMFLLFFIQILKPAKVIGFIASIVALLSVYILSESYIADESLSIWNKLGALSAFYGTVFVLGGAFSLWVGRKLETSYFKRYAATILILGFILSISAKTSWIAVFIVEDLVFESNEFKQGLYTLAIQAILAIFGLFFLLWEKSSKYPALLALGMLCFLMAELFSRSLFFLTQFKIDA